MPDNTKDAVNKSPDFQNMDYQGLTMVFYHADFEGLTSDVTKWSYSVDRTTVGIFIIPNQEASLKEYISQLKKFMASARKFEQAILLLSPCPPKHFIDGREKAKTLFSTANCSIIDMMEVQADDASILAYSSKIEPVGLAKEVLFSTKMTTMNGHLTKFGVNSILATVASHLEDPDQKIQRCLGCGARHNPKCQSHVSNAQL